MNLIQETPLLSFHNNPQIKAEYVERAKAKTVFDERIIKHSYRENGTIRYDYMGIDYWKYERVLGIPVIIASLKNVIARLIPKSCSEEYSLQFLLSIPVGRDLSVVWKRLFLWMLVDENEGVLKLANTEPNQVAVLLVAEVLRKSLSNEVTKEELQEADRVAYAAYTSFAGAEASSFLWAMSTAWVIASIALNHNENPLNGINLVINSWIFSCTYSEFSGVPPIYYADDEFSNDEEYAAHVKAERMIIRKLANKLLELLAGA
jgi:hypothetical protein